MSPLIAELKSPPSSVEKSFLSDKEIKEIISLWKENLSSYSQLQLIKEVLKSSLRKIEKTLEYTNPEDKKIAMDNALHFLNVLGLYLSSRLYESSKPQTMDELINGLNSLCPEPLFLTTNSIFTDASGNTFKIKKITPSHEILNNSQGGYISGTNMWDSPPGKQFIPGHYWLEKLKN